MSIGPLVSLNLSYMQNQAESMMTDACIITRRDPAGVRVLNPATGEYAEPTPLTMYTGKCRLSGHKTRFDKVVEAGGEPVTTMREFVDLPVNAQYEAAVDDVVEMTASLDPSVVGQKLRVRQLQFGSQMTARHLGCEWTELAS